ncbi:hypothetical protein [Zhihengliuella alba]|uniref:hypothetical protein n=1 Tax=Zhihengliuella alba TaxID=547018 RepID=UPI0031E77C26
MDRDNLLFLDPSAIRNGSDALSKAANDTLIRFFAEVLRLRSSASPTDHAIGQELLSHLHEPNETRLGMSVASKFGRAFGSQHATDLWDLLGKSREAQASVMTRLEHLRLFADGVGYDLISDATTRILFGHLCDFTQSMMKRYPELMFGAKSVDAEVFDTSSLTWEARSTELPIADGRTLLLVPKGWVYWRTLMDVGPFYNRYASATVQDEQTVIRSDGKAIKPSKKSIREANRDMRTLNRDQATKYKTQKGRDLVAEYQEFVDREFDGLSDFEIIRRTGE